MFKVIFLSTDRRIKDNPMIYERPIKKTLKNHNVGDYIFLKNIKLVNIIYGKEEKQNLLAKVVKKTANVYVVDIPYMGVDE